jgi:hypothetical protein
VPGAGPEDAGLGEFSTRAGADKARGALQERVGELARSTDGKSRWNKKDYFLATANPRFFVRSKDEPPDFKPLWARDAISRLGNQPIGHEAPEEVALRFFWPMLRGILDQAAALESASAPMAEVTAKNSPMSVAEANDEAIKQANEWRDAFYAMSKRQQAKLIGCHHRTWQKNPILPRSASARENKRAQTESGKSGQLHKGA